MTPRAPKPELDDDTMQAANDSLAKIGLAPSVTTNDEALRDDINGIMDLNTVGQRGIPALAQHLAATPTERDVWPRPGAHIPGVTDVPRSELQAEDAGTKRTRTTVGKLLARYQEREHETMAVITAIDKQIADLQRERVAAEAELKVWGLAISEIND